MERKGKKIKIERRESRNASLRSVDRESKKKTEEEKRDQRRRDAQTQAGGNEKQSADRGRGKQKEKGKGGEIGEKGAKKLSASSRKLAERKVVGKVKGARGMKDSAL